MRTTSVLCPTASMLVRSKAARRLHYCPACFTSYQIEPGRMCFCTEDNEGSWHGTKLLLVQPEWYDPLDAADRLGGEAAVRAVLAQEHKRA